MRANKPGRRPFQPREICVRHGLEVALGGVHPVPDAVGDDHIPGHAECLHVLLALFERPFHARAEALRFDHEVAVLRSAGQGPKHRYVNAAPLDGDSLRGPAEQTKERHHEVRDQLVLARRLAKGLPVLEERNEIGRLGGDPLQDAGNLLERRFLGRKVRQRGRLPVNRGRVE